MTVEEYNRQALKEWLEVADEDLRAAKVCVRPDVGALRGAAFHAQQCVEKSIKTLYIRANRDIPRTPDLVALAETVKDVHDLADSYDNLRWLTGWAVLGRYPGENPQPRSADACRAIQIAEGIYDALRSK
ncbi:MAG: HEPN domain protein [Lentisphaerae bacterium ADurb.BinA184]|nr:MAG: HEPN domain protein [Lentisphaerae bacterium ADurb.BinA184]